MALTRRQRCFVDEYLVDLNGTQAAIRAGYSKRTANEQAARLLANVSVAQAVAEGMSKRSERTGVTQDWVIERLKREALLDGDGATHSARVQALTAIGKHLGMFKDQIEHSGELKGAVVLTLPDNGR